MAKTLLDKGFTRIKVIKGGMQAWEAAAYPMKYGAAAPPADQGGAIQINPAGGQSGVVPVNPGTGNQSIVVTIPPPAGGAAPAKP